MATVAQEYGYFFNSSDGDRTYNAESFEAWVKPLLSNGVFGTGMKVSAQSTPGMSVSVAAGYANIEGKVAAWPSANTVTISTASGVYPRIDTVVLRRDNANRRIVLDVVTGTAASNPSPKAPTRNADTYELVLAQIYVGAGVTSITAGNITDTRINPTLCGFVTCPVVNPDFSDLYDQFTEQFDTWFDHMKDQLDSDAAGHLQQEIDDLEADMLTISEQTLTDAQQEQVRGNIGAASEADFTALETDLTTVTSASISKASGVSGGTLADNVCRKVGKTVFASGRLHSFTAKAASGTFMVIPSGYRPKVTTYVNGYIYVVNVGQLPVLITINTNGNVNIAYSSGSNTNQVAFAGSWSVD